MERAELGIDGNCGFALLGENIQEGDCEFVEIPTIKNFTEIDCQRIAARQAYLKLKERHPEISYFFGKLHPSYIGD